MCCPIVQLSKWHVSESWVLKVELRLRRSIIAWCCIWYGNIHGKINHVSSNCHPMPRHTAGAWGIYCAGSNENWWRSGGTFNVLTMKYIIRVYS